MGPIRWFLQRQNFLESPVICCSEVMKESVLLSLWVSKLEKKYSHNIATYTHSAPGLINLDAVENTHNISFMCKETRGGYEAGKYRTVDWAELSNKRISAAINRIIGPKKMWEWRISDTKCRNILEHFLFPGYELKEKEVLASIHVLCIIIPLLCRLYNIII